MLAEGEPVFFGLIAIFVILILLAIAGSQGWLGPI